MPALIIAVIYLNRADAEIMKCTEATLTRRRLYKMTAKAISSLLAWQHPLVISLRKPMAYRLAP